MLRIVALPALLLALLLGAAPAPAAVFSPETGNHYRYVPDAVTFAEALALAELETLDYAGRVFEGHLATITSAAENAVVQSFNRSVWIAGAEIGGSGVWEWVAGPEAGQTFWEGGLGGAAPTGAYANFFANEPNDQNGVETRLEFTFVGQWNDLPPDATRGFMVEFETSVVPLPAAGWLLLGALGALGAAARRSGKG